MGEPIEIGSLDAEYRAAGMVRTMVAYERSPRADPVRMQLNRDIAMQAAMLMLDDDDGHRVQQMVVAARAGELDKRIRELCALLGKDADAEFADWVQMESGEYD